MDPIEYASAEQAKEIVRLSQALGLTQDTREEIEENWTKVEADQELVHLREQTSDPRTDRDQT